MCRKEGWKEGKRFRGKLGTGRRARTIKSLRDDET